MDQLEKVGKKLLGSQIEDSLMEYILNEPVAIGEKLPNEFELAEKFGVDALRFFLLRTFPFGSDGNFSNELLIGTINTDLANKLGNLVSRTTGMAEKYFGGKLPVQREDAPEDCELKKMACALRDRYQAEMDKLQLQNGLDEVFKVIDRANKYIDETAPWALGKDENKRERLAAVLYNLSLIHI